jgi:16S rRNA (adenine1518-N6/adenine1519-N6)-dimethyltransferase
MAIKPRKQFGQHWLKNNNVLEQIILTAEITKDDRILEIGPGKGVLTEKLFTRGGNLLSVEIMQIFS